MGLAPHSHPWLGCVPFRFVPAVLLVDIRELIFSMAFCWYIRVGRCQRYKGNPASVSVPVQRLR
jgi:hypothetical protein